MAASSSSPPRHARPLPFLPSSMSACPAGAARGSERDQVVWTGGSVAACPRLQAIDISHCVAAGNREMAAVAGLRKLALDKCLAVTDVGLAKVAVGCPRLQRLSLKWCLEISDIGVELLAKECHDLQSHDISYLNIDEHEPLLQSFDAESLKKQDYSELEDQKLEPVFDGHKVQITILNDFYKSLLTVL